VTVWESLPQARVSRSISRRLREGSLPHAWLLLGPRGSGKRATALAVAAALNCPESPGVGCGGCHSCTRVIRQRHPDVHIVVPEGPIISVEVIREMVIPEAARSPYEGAYKVFIVEEAERMNPPAQNALLKTLEEPPTDTVFILICDQEDELLETIRSRCHEIRLFPPSEEELTELLIDEGAQPGRARLAARLSEGDVGIARAIAFDDGALERRRFFAALAGRLTSPPDALDAAAEIGAEAASAVRARAAEQKQEMVELAEAVGEGRGTATLRSSLARRHKRELRRVEEIVLVESLESLGSFYRDVLAVRRGAGETVSNMDLVAEIELWAASDVGDGNLVAAVHRCAVTPGALARNANQSLAIEATLLELAGFVPPPDARRSRAS
jgi:DNA polymerase III subunit delta'